MDKNISHFIVETCKKLGIENYHSINPNYIEFTNDAQLLRQLYKDLIEISAKLFEIGERHQIDGLGKKLQEEIDALTKVNHDLVKFANELNKKEE